MNKKVKWFLAIFFGLVLLIVITWQIVKNLKIEKYIQQTAQTELNRLWPGKVQFSYESIRFNFLKKEIDLNNVKFQIFGADTRDTLASLTLKKLSVKWYSYKNLIKQDTFKIKHVTFNQLTSSFPIDFEKIKPAEPQDSANNSPFKLSVKTVSFINSSFILYKQKGEQTGQISSNFELSIDNVFYDSQVKPSLKNSNLKGVIINFKKLNYFLPDGFHQLYAEQISLRPLQGAAFVKQLIFKPIYKWSKFAALKKVQKDHITLKADSVWLGGFIITDTMAFIGEQIDIKNPELFVHKDKNYKIPDDRFVPVLVDQLENADFPVYVKKIIVQNMYLDYKELPRGGTQRGHIFINHLNGLIENITNIKDSVECLEEKSLIIRADGKLYGKGLLEADIRYTLQSDDGHFVVKGGLAPMMLKEGNELLDPLSPLKIRSGQVDQLYFYFSGGRSSATGKMIFKYSHLKVDAKNSENKKFKNDIMTLYANLIVPEFNPKPNGKLRIGKISVTKRDTRSSMFKFWVDNLMSGFKSTIGITDAAEIEENENENTGKGFWGKIGLKNKSSE